jgi:hypothetical protein
MSKMDESKREAERLQEVILAWQQAHDVTALGELHRVSLAHAILCARVGVAGSDDAFFDVYALGVGHVLTEQDVADIQKVLADYNEEIEKNVDLYSDARTAVLREIGGDELVAAAATVDEAISQGACDKALARFYGPASDFRTKTQQRLDLAALLRRIVHRHERGLPLDDTLKGATDYLSRNDLNGSPLRDADDDVLAKEPSND